MADPTGGSPGDLFTYIGMGIGGIIAVVVARLGWNSGGKAIKAPEDVVEVRNAIVDSKSIQVLSASIEGHAMTGRELAKRAEENASLLAEKLHDHNEELRNLAREIRELAREIAKRP